MSELYVARDFIRTTELSLIWPQIEASLTLLVGGQATAPPMHPIYLHETRTMPWGFDAWRDPSARNGHRTAALHLRCVWDA
jgi:hypothetical protein